MTLSPIKNDLRRRLQPLCRQDDGSYLTSIHFDRAFCGFAGHFDHNPIVPAVCLVAAAEMLASDAVGKPLQLREIAQMKFKKLLAPEADAVFSFRQNAAESGLYTFIFTITTRDGQSVARIKLQLAESA